MGISSIEWTDYTFNPWLGCTKVKGSPACALCYAQVQEDQWLGRAKWGKGNPRHHTSEGTWKKPARWNKEAARSGERKRTFCASLADVFDPEVPASWIHELWDLIRRTPNLDWLLLTKRPQEIAGKLPADWGDGWDHVWLGVTAENQRWADERLRILAGIPAKTRFASCEPLLGDLDLTAHLPNLDWVIGGGESGGRKARPTQPEWARHLRDQCQAATVAFFWKQWGSHDEHGQRMHKKLAGRLLDGRVWDEVPASPAPAPKPPRALPKAKAKSKAKTKSHLEPLTPELRQRIVAALRAGGASAEVGAALGQSVGRVAAIKAHITMNTYD
jgi:protein gp37